MAIVRKVLVSASERIGDSTLLDIVVVDHNEADPPASKQVGQSMTIEVEDDPSYEGADLETWFEMLLEDVRVLILQEIVAKNVDDIFKQRFAHHG
jgi:hypothetical protein